MESISFTGVVVVRIQVSVIARMSGCKLSVKVIDISMCEGIRNEC